MTEGRDERLVSHPHPRFFWSPVVLLCVTLSAASDEVLPRVVPASRPRQDVVEGEIRTRSTVDTLEAVTPIDVLLAQVETTVRQIQVREQTDHLGPGDRPRRHDDVGRVLLHHLGLALPHELVALLEGGDVDRLVVRVQY